jgi:hypothetical protein
MLVDSLHYLANKFDISARDFGPRKDLLLETSDSACEISSHVTFDQQLSDFGGMVGILIDQDDFIQT